MKRNRKICFVMLLLIIHVTLAGCVPSNVRIQTIDRQMLSLKKTGLIAGLKEIKDNRPENEIVNDQYYEKPSSSTINDILYKNLKLSGIFEDVLIGTFDNKDVDVILDSNVDHFYYESGANGFTAVSFILALTGFPGLIYLLAGGPTAEHRAEANLGIKMTTIDGNVLASASSEKKLAVNANMHNQQSDGLGMIEGRALSDATYDMLLSFSANIDLDKLPKAKFAKSSICGSDKDCKGDRICVSGMCVNPQK